MLVLVTCFVGLSAWQVDRAEHKNDVVDSQNVDEVKDFNALMGAEAPMPGILADQRVSLSGQWLPDDQVVVPDRVLDGKSGYWVVTMFAPTGAHLGDGAQAETDGKTIAIPVVRGFTADESTAMASRAQTGEVSMTARIGPVEGPVPGNDLPDGQVHTVSTSQLINLFPDLLTYSGLLIPETVEGAAASVGVDGLSAVPPTQTRDSGGLDLQSAGYAVEWLIFAAMALYMWWRLLADDYMRRRLSAGENSQDPAKRVEYVVVKDSGQGAIDPAVMAELTGLPAHRVGGKKSRRARSGARSAGAPPTTSSTDTTPTEGR